MISVHASRRERPAPAGVSRSVEAGEVAVDVGTPAAESTFRHDGLFWRRFAQWGSTRTPHWWRRVGPAIVGGIVFTILRENRRNAIENLRRIRGHSRGAGDAREANEANEVRAGRFEAAAAALRLFVEMAYCVSESFEFSSPSGRPIEVESPEGFDPTTVLGAGRGLVVLTSHFGTWEIGAQVMRRYVPSVNVVMAREANATVERFQREAREGSGLRVIRSDTSVFSSLNMIHALRRGEVVALQLDRGAPGQVTREIELFGRPARFQVGPFVLARLAGVPIWPVFVARTGPRRYRFMPEPLRTIRRDASEAEVLDVMREVVRGFERAVQAYPHQWFQYRRVWDAPDAKGRP